VTGVIVASPGFSTASCGGLCVCFVSAAVRYAAAGSDRRVGRTLVDGARSHGRRAAAVLLQQRASTPGKTGTRAVPATSAIPKSKEAKKNKSADLLAGGASKPVDEVAPQADQNPLPISVLMVETPKSPSIRSTLRLPCTSNSPSLVLDWSGNSTGQHLAESALAHHAADASVEAAPGLAQLGCESVAQCGIQGVQ